LSKVQSRSSFLNALSAVLLWSTVATAFKITLSEIPFDLLLLYSSAVSFFALSIIAIFKTGIKSLSAAILSPQNILLGFINPFLYYLVLFKAYSLLPAQEAQPLNYTWPIAISIFSVVFLKQKLSLKITSGLIIAFLGVTVIATRGDFSYLNFSNISGVLLATGSSVSWAAYWTLNMILKQEDHLKLTGAFFWGVTFSLIYFITFGQDFIFSFKAFTGSAYIGLFEMGITFFLWMKGIQLSKNKAKTSTLAYLSPFISLLFISAILKESLMISSVIGLLMIVSGILIQQTERTE